MNKMPQYYVLLRYALKIIIIIIIIIITKIAFRLFYCRSRKSVGTDYFLSSTF